MDESVTLSLLCYYELLQVIFYNDAILRTGNSATSINEKSAVVTLGRLDYLKLSIFFNLLPYRSRFSKDGRFSFGKIVIDSCNSVNLNYFRLFKLEFENSLISLRKIISINKSLSFGRFIMGNLVILLSGPLM